MPGFGDLMKIMAHAKELKEAAEKLKTELPSTLFTASGANGGVSVTIAGDLTVREIKIAPEMLTDHKYLEQELLTAFNSANLSAKTAMQERLKGAASGLGLEMPQ